MENVPPSYRSRCLMPTRLSVSPQWENKRDKLSCITRRYMASLICRFFSVAAEPSGPTGKIEKAAQVVDRTVQSSHNDFRRNIQSLTC